jgi:hypothetical protein
MQHDVRLQYQQVIDESHQGHPVVTETVQTGCPGRPAIQIDPQFLQWAYSLRSISGIARFLDVSWRIVCQQLLEHGIAQPQQQPFMLSVQYQDNVDEDFLDPSGEILPAEAGASSSGSLDATPDGPDAPVITSYTSPQSDISNDDLDALLVRLRRHFLRSGVTMLDGMLQRLGYRVPRERVQQSLIWIDPVQHVFQRIQIRRHVYSVPGPNSLWHHDGQHGK